jgi:hypothetical protein
MGLIRIGCHQKAKQAEIKSLLDATHRAVFSAFKVPSNARLITLSVLGGVGFGP